MAQQIEPFRRIESVRASQTIHAWPVATQRLMLVHFTLFGLALLLSAAVLFGYLYTLELERIEFSGGLRIARPGDIYTADFQLKAVGVLLLVGASVVQFQTVNLLAQRRRSALLLARGSAVLLLGGLPAGVMLWLMSGQDVEDAGLVQQVMTDLALVVRLVAGLLVFQALLALWYVLASLLLPMRRYCRLQAPLVNPLLRRVRRVSVILWVVVIAGLGVVLGVLTDWLYELPVVEPDPGELLYATSFDDFNDEWDLFPGRDAAQVADLDTLDAAVTPHPALTDQVLVIKYGAGVSDEVIWSTLDRKFADFDLRVTARLLEGPIDQNQFGVIFRYRNANNFYIFRITADGYYSLVRVQDGVQEKISDWGITDVIAQGDTPNTLRIIARGDTFTFFVNDTPVPLCLKGENETSMWANWEGPGICFTDEPRLAYQDDTFKQGRIALAAGTIDGSDVRVAFDDLVIVGPDPAINVLAIE